MRKWMVLVNDRMQKGDRYQRTARPGRNFEALLHWAYDSRKI
jgi:hypothetical protein